MWSYALAAFAVALALPAQALALPRATADRADDVAGKQIHVVYALPSDGSDRSLDTNGTLAGSVTSFQNWLASKADGRRLRLDTYQGQPDVTFFELSETDAEVRARDPYIRDFIEDEIQAAGFTQPDKLYAVYYDGTSDWSCGGGAWPPALPGPVAALYLRGLPDYAWPCDSNAFDLTGQSPAYLEFAMLHEIMHTLGFAPSCAPNQYRAGHVSDDQNDLMWAGDDSWAPTGWGALTLDTGNDDYYRHSNAGCLDFDDSEFLTPPPAFADVPPSSPFFNYIEELYARGITTGCSFNPASGERRFCPLDTVTRRDMAVFIVRAKGLSQLTPATGTFSDVPTTMFGFGHVERFYEQGITTGCATTPVRLYCPLDNVTRRDMAVFMVRAKGLTPLLPATATFSDVPTSMFGFGQVERFFEQGITNGCATTPVRLYCPLDNVTREAMAAFLIRAFP